MNAKSAAAGSPGSTLATEMETAALLLAWLVALGILGASALLFFIAMSR